MRKRNRVAVLGLAALAVIGLGACGQSEPAEPAAKPATSTPAATPAPATPVPIVDQDMFQLVAGVERDYEGAQKLVDLVCTLPQTPTELIAVLAKDEPKGDKFARVQVRLAVMAGCPQKRDWVSKT